ncbi:MAG: amidohydrolase family protein [Clostridiales bacterium]|nr:amidohydrolase family protein [Clostridiales bacterium]
MSITRKISQLKVKSHNITRPKFPAIDFHTHFGKLLGAMAGTENYFDLYETKDTIAEIKSYGIEKVVNVDGGFGDEYLRMMDKLKDAGDFIINFGQVDIMEFESPEFEAKVNKVMGEHHKNGIKGLKFWKNIGLVLKDSNGNYLRPDDERLKCIWSAAAEYDMPVLFHIADMNAFFTSANEENELIETFRDHPEWLFNKPGMYSFDELMEMQERLLEENPKTKFVIAHVGSYAENLGQVGRWLDKYPNMYVDIADRLSELGRQPYTAREFFTEYADRIVFGTDLLPMDVERYPIYFRFLETYDEYFSYRTDKGVPLGDWNIYGIGLDDTTLQKVYRDNAKKLLKIG